MDFLSTLHPKMVHFPIALFMTYTLLEVISIIIKNESMSKAAFMVLLLGVLGGLAAILTGHNAGEAAEKLADVLNNPEINIPLGTLSKHEDFATYTFWLFTATAAFRTFLVIKKKFTGRIRYIFIVLALAGSVLVYITADFGGRLVYESGVGTSLIKPDGSINPK